MLSLLRDEDMDSIPANFVEGLFDEYASYYERDVIEKLRYRVPGLIRRYLLKAVPGRTRFASVLDLGCGTGLTGVMLRDIADFQKGVDISRNMLKLALEKEIYDQLEAADLQVSWARSTGPTPSSSPQTCAAISAGWKSSSPG